MGKHFQFYWKRYSFYSELKKPSQRFSVYHNHISNICVVAFVLIVFTVSALIYLF